MMENYTKSLRKAALLLFSAHLLHASALPAASSYEFTAYRMQQYSLQQEKHGVLPSSHYDKGFHPYFFRMKTLALILD